MSTTHSAAIAQSHLRLQHRTRHLSIPQYHILILAWSALVILYGETGLAPLFPPSSGKVGVDTLASC
jgi:hypothetical protein